MGRLSPEVAFDKLRSAATEPGQPELELAWRSIHRSESGVWSGLAAVLGLKVRIEEVLAIACLKDDREIVTLLLRHGARVNSRLRSGASPLEICAAWSTAETLRLISSHERPLPPYLNHALVEASIAGKVESIEILLAHGADPQCVCSGPEGVIWRFRPAVLRRLVAAGGRLPTQVQKLLDDSPY